MRFMGGGSRATPENLTDWEEKTGIHGKKTQRYETKFLRY